MEPKPFFLSSADPTKLSMTIKGLLTGLIPLILIVARTKGVTVSQEQIGGTLDVIDQAIIAVTGAYAAFGVLYGIGRKIYYVFFPKTQY